MSELAFGGWICRGIGRHSGLGVPGRDALPNQAPADWPQRLEPGSLNVCIDRFPAQVPRVEDLDEGRIRPVFEIRHDQFSNNALFPISGMPRRGDAQVWRGKVGGVGDCWVLRRIGSTVGAQLEFVADRRLLGPDLSIGQRVEAVIYGDWRT